MISAIQLQQLAVKLATNELNIKREYLQHQFLNVFYQRANSEQCLFKGGTALRLVFQSPRFSEDLDFSTKLPPFKITDIILSSLKSIETLGITHQVIKNGPTSGGYLAEINFSLLNQTVPLIFQFSNRKQLSHGEVVTISSPMIPPYPISILDRDQLIQEKITALITRSKPRDFYDLYFLLRSYLITPAMKRQLDEVKPIVAQTEINFEHELKLYLPASHWLVIRNFKHSLIQEINRHL